MPQRDCITMHKTKNLLVSVLAIFMLSWTLSQTVFAIDTVLSTNVDNYQTIDENTSLLHTNTKITNKELIGCNFDITVILDDGVLVRDLEPEILEHMSFTPDEHGVLTIDTDMSVVISNALEQEIVSHSIVIKNAKNITFDGVFMEQPENSNLPLLDVLNHTNLIVNEVTTSENILKSSTSNSTPIINGIENLYLSGNGSLTIFSNEEHCSLYENLEKDFIGLSIVPILHSEDLYSDEIALFLAELFDEVLKEEAYWNSVSAEATDYLLNCDFYITVDVGNGKIVDNYNEKILAYVGFNDNVDEGIVTIKTSKPVSISNKYGVDESVNHRIIVTDGLDEDGLNGADITFSGVNIVSSSFDAVSALELNSLTSITIGDFEFFNEVQIVNILEIANNSPKETISGFENITEVKGDGLLNIISNENDSNNYSDLGENVSNIKVTFFDNSQEIQVTYSNRAEVILGIASNDIEPTFKFTVLYDSLPILNDIHFNSFDSLLDSPLNNYSEPITEQASNLDYDLKQINIDEQLYIDNTKNSTPNSKYTVIGGSDAPLTNAAIELFETDEHTEETNAIFQDVSFEFESISHLPLIYSDSSTVPISNFYNDIDDNLSTNNIDPVVLSNFGFLFGSKAKFPYTDISQDDELYQHIQNVYDNDIQLGITEYIFSADTTVARNTIIAGIYQLEGAPKTTFKEVFDDVSKDDINAEAIIWAYENEIVFGIGDNLFNPYGAITFEEIATMLHRYTVYKDLDNEARADIEGFSDFNNVSNYAIEHLEWAVGNNLIEGTTRSELLPRNEATRGEAVVITSKYLYLCHGNSI